MKTRFFPLFFLLLLATTANAQKKNGFARPQADVLPEAFKLDVPTIREHIHEGIPSEIKDGSFAREAYLFADQAALQVTGLVASGDIYSDWAIFEEYLNEIFQKVIPEELRGEENVHAYLIKNGTYNAFMTPAGMTFVHIGLFADVRDEAALAGILAHEFAHYYMRHSLKGFIKAEKGGFNEGLFNNRSASKFSVANELQSDSLAMIWMKESGYDLDGLIEGFEMMEQREKNRISRSATKWKLKATTHPLSASRLEAMNAFKKKNKELEGKRFLISESKFRQFKEMAKAETLEFLLRDFNYSACLEMAFRFHLYDPNRASYIYYMMESIRRMCYLKPELWTENFITNRYYEAEGEGAERRKVKRKKHLFEEFPADILCFSEADKKAVRANFYWEELKFVTYEEAFEFFQQVGRLFKEPECILSNALSITKNKEVRDKLLTEYLAFEKIRHRDYAESLKAGTITTGLPDKKMTVMSQLQTIVRQGQDDILIRTHDHDAADPVALLFDSIMIDFPERKKLYLPGYKDEQLNNYKMLSELERFSFISTVSKGQKTELHILAPKYWEALNQYGVNEIEFINAAFIEARKVERTTDAYKEVIALGHEDVFRDIKRTKYLQIYVTSIREIKDGVMKIRFYDGEHRLVFKDPAYSQIVEMMKDDLKGKEERAEELDRKNRKK